MPLFLRPGISHKQYHFLMDLDFEIMKLFDHHNRGQFIFARHKGIDHSFEVTEGATFGGIPVYHYTEMPRMLDENQQPRLDVFVFRPLSRFPSGYFKEGQIATLVIASKEHHER